MALSKLDSTALGTLSGNIVFADGQGIDFSATSDGFSTMSSELFDDYEEGTWTPVVSAGISSPTYDNQSGRYTKIGNLVCTDFYIRVSGTGNNALFQIDGLPYNIGTNLTRGGGVTSYQNILAYTGQLYGNPNDNKFSIYYNGSSEFKTSSSLSSLYLIGSFTYLT